VTLGLEGKVRKDSEDEIMEILYKLLENTSEEERETKRHLRESEVNDDVLKSLKASGKIQPSDLLKSCLLFFFFELQHIGLLSFLYKDPYDWIKFKQAFYTITETFNEFFVIKKTRGRPQSDFMKTVILSMILHHSKAKYYHLGTRDVYRHLLLDALQIRLTLSTDWEKKQTAYESDKLIAREFKAAKVAVDRFWTVAYGKTPPAIDYKETKKQYKDFFMDEKKKQMKKAK
jgi:hypothetical protein